MRKKYALALTIVALLCAAVIITIYVRRAGECYCRYGFDDLTLQEVIDFEDGYFLYIFEAVSIDTPEGVECCPPHNFATSKQTFHRVRGEARQCVEVTWWTHNLCVECWSTTSSSERAPGCGGEQWKKYYQ